MTAGCPLLSRPMCTLYSSARANERYWVRMDDLMAWVAERESVERDRSELKMQFHSLDRMVADARLRVDSATVTPAFCDAWASEATSRVERLRTIQNRRRGEALAAHIAKYETAATAMLDQLRVEIEKVKASYISRERERVARDQLTALRNQARAERKRGLNTERATRGGETPKRRPSTFPPETESPRPNANWVGVKWSVASTGTWHAVLPIDVAFCGIGTNHENAGPPRGAVCSHCASLANVSADARRALFPERVQVALNAHDRDTNARKRARSGRGSSVRTVSGGLPSMGKRV